MLNLVLIAHNLRSSHNVGSLLRTAEGLGVTQVFLTGYTPYPWQAADRRLPNIAAKVNRQIVKTALGAENMVAWQHAEHLEPLLSELRDQGFVIAALEQAPHSLSLPTYRPVDKLAILVGREVEGIEPENVNLCDLILEIPMLGHKESFNVVQAAAMALYHCRFGH